MTFLSMLFISAVSLAGGNVVGNAGDGFMVGDELHLRDLIEVKTDGAPWIGEALDPALPAEELNRALAPLDWPTGLLQRKLNDMNRIAPGSGDALISLIRSYDWKITDDDDTTENERSFFIPEKDEASRIQIAIRRFGVITIHRSAWARMPDSHRAALIVHEALFSSMQPLCMGPSNCLQPQLTSRYRIGLLFNESWMKTIDDEMADFRSDFVTNLDTTFHLPLADLTATISIGDVILPLDLRSEKVAPAVRALCSRNKGAIPAIVLRSKTISLERRWYTHRSGGLLDFRRFKVGGERADEISIDAKRPCEEALLGALRDARMRLLPAEERSSAP